MLLYWSGNLRKDVEPIHRILQMSNYLPYWTICAFPGSRVILEYLCDCIQHICLIDVFLHTSLYIFNSESLYEWFWTAFSSVFSFVSSTHTNFSGLFESPEVFYNKDNLAFGFLEILNVSFGNEQIANTTTMKSQTRVIFRKWKSLCWSGGCL